MKRKTFSFGAGRVGAFADPLGCGTPFAEPFVIFPLDLEAILVNLNWYGMTGGVIERDHRHCMRHRRFRQAEC